LPATYAEFLDTIRPTLVADERIVAAWVGGSVGRGDADRFSDLDLTVVVTDTAATPLCARPQPVQAGAPSERLAFVSQFDAPVVVHENHANAPEGGAFTLVVYGDTAQQVDWTFVPRAVARRPTDTLLLFERVPIPSAERVPTSRDVTHIEERIAFAWLLALPAARALLRDDAVAFHGLLNAIWLTLLDIERGSRGNATHFRRRSAAPFMPTRAKQARALRAACDRLVALAPQPIANGAVRPDAARRVIEEWLGMLEE
jgi:hypothetical protein